MKTKGLAVVICCLASWVWAQEGPSPLFSGKVSTNIPFSPVEALGQPLETKVQVLAGGELELGAWGAKARLGIVSAKAQFLWLVTEGWLSYRDGPLMIRTGWWPDHSGPAIFRSVVPRFTVVAGTDFLATAGEAQPVSPFKAHASIAWEEFSLEADLAPWPGGPALSDPTSRWFPNKDIPNQYTVPVVGWVNTRIGAVSVVDETTGTSRLGPAGKLQGRWSALWGDFTMGMFYGPDNQVVYAGQIVDQIYPSGTYVFNLLARQNFVTTGWATVEIPWKNGKFWFEQNLSGNHLRMGKQIEDYQAGFAQKTRVANLAETVVGGSYLVALGPWGSLRTWGEGNVQEELNTERNPTPDFVEGLEAGIHWDLPRDWGSLDLLGGTPWDPAQGWLWTRATWNWMEGRTLWVGAPMFWGAADTAWGQFSSRRVWALGTTWDQ